ncbi:hypothetical protein GCM10010441_09520 [Kitasatospora paracochleata]|uniref:Uncharacterized protein n=1 Tax=Kitasatospora paracochleata TaxID=58354 RepID=A0ABT1IXH2_9ACTN|nr:hypothetical protein [Kitasatospora paracochleata]MCP2309852.1 hypothetical protein [Kitasatospora paracochleata]
MASTTPAATPAPDGRATGPEPVRCAEPAESAEAAESTESRSEVPMSALLASCRAAAALSTPPDPQPRPEPRAA